MRQGKRLRPERIADRPKVEDRGGIALIRLGPANIWDAGDLTRLREAAGHVFDRGERRLGIDLAHVGVLPSGFLHMLCTWQERGAEVYLFAPRPNVRAMFWFEKFAEPAGEDVWRMACVPPEEEWPDRRGPAVRNGSRLEDQCGAGRAAEETRPAEDHTVFG